MAVMNPRLNLSIEIAQPMSKLGQRDVTTRARS
jgi:hypothetical protein